MIYAKHKTTQSEFVAAWWDKVEKVTAQKLEERYPGISSVKLFDGMTYADKLRAIPNNALRRAGLKPRCRNGKRKKEQTVLSQASMQKILRNMNAMVSSVAALEIQKRTEQFADSANAFGEQAPDPYKSLIDDYKRYSTMRFGAKFDTRIKMWRTDE